MTGIGGPEDGQIGFGTGSFPAQDMLDNDRPGLDRRYGDLSSLAGKETESGEESLNPGPVVTRNEADFLECFRAANSGQPVRARSKDGVRHENHEDMQIIAVAEQRNSVFLATSVNTVSPVTGAAAGAIEAKVSFIAETIERAIRLEMAPQPGQPLNVHIDFADEVLSLQGLNVTVTPLNIEIILLRTGSVVSDELAGAAQSLADRLMARFSKRAVRIVQSVTSSKGDSRQFHLPQIPGTHLLPQEV
jgi:hypothetical protein